MGRSAGCFASLLILCLVTGSVVVPARAADDGEDAAHRDAIRAWVMEHREQILDELTGFLSLPNDGHDAEAMQENARALQALLTRRGLEASVLPGSEAPYVYARLRPAGKPAAQPPPVVLFYCHYDGQPVDPSRWTMSEPYAPTLRGDIADPDARLYARSAADDKSPIIALMAAIDALRAAGIPPSIDARFIFDPEEEMGSPRLEEALVASRDLLAADLMIFADGPLHQSGQPTVVFGTRGIITVTMTMYGPARALHSGHYGNWAPNPAEKLVTLLASMKSPHGKALVEGFYDDVVPLTVAEREALASIPPEDGLQESLLIAQPDGHGHSLQELINLPSLNLRGLSSGWVGAEARTIVPATATAELDLRLVKDVDPLTQVAKIRAHATRMGYHVVEDEPSDELRRLHPNVVRITHGPGTAAAKTDLDSSLSRSVILAVRRAAGAEPVLLPTLGGTGPLSRFEEILGFPVYGIPIVNFDNNQHAPDENLRLGNFWNGIVTYASLLRLPPVETD